MCVCASTRICVCVCLCVVLINFLATLDYVRSVWAG